MISRQRKEEIVGLFERRLKGPGSTQEIRKISKEELKQTFPRLSYRNENADLQLAVNAEINQRYIQLLQKWLIVIIVTFIVGLGVGFGKEFILLLPF